MKQSKIIAGNLKANLTPELMASYLAKLESSKKLYENHQIIIFPNQACLSKNCFSFELGAQNAYPAKSGSFTGEIGLELLSSLDIKTILLGHSERRSLLKETNELILEKFKFFKNENFKIILCIGEDSNTKDIRAFLHSQLEGINLDYKDCILAYEPIFAIGSKASATLEHIQKVCSILKELGAKKILYGGSVSLDNAKDIISLVDGLLIGRASLDVDEFMQIIKLL